MFQSDILIVSIRILKLNNCVNKNPMNGKDEGELYIKFSEEGDNGLRIKQVLKVLHPRYLFFCFYPMNLICRRGNFVYHPLSYPL